MAGKIAAAAIDKVFEKASKCVFIYVSVFFTNLIKIDWDICAGGHLKGINKKLKNVFSCIFLYFERL